MHTYMQAYIGLPTRMHVVKRMHECWRTLEFK